MFIAAKSWQTDKTNQGHMFEAKHRQPITPSGAGPHHDRKLYRFIQHTTELPHVCRMPSPKQSQFKDLTRKHPS